MADQIERFEMVRSEIDTAKANLTRICGDTSRELSLCLTKLDEARMWAHEAIAAKERSNGSSQSGFQ